MPPRRPRGPRHGPDVDSDGLDVLRAVAAALDALGLPYVVGGSVASGIHGEPRYTQDVDVLVDLGPWQVSRLVEALGVGWRLDEDAAMESIRRGASFNASKPEIGGKVDFFPRQDSLLHRAHLARRRRLTIPADPEFSVWVTSPEDIILQQLLWYRMSDGALERHLRDVAGVLKAQGERIDLAYLRRMAGLLGLTDLLERALRDSGLPT